ncbi:MAG: oxygen-independent coproporphyrinogen III oxidase [Verrucomicrobia bacterium]|nr:oxygen-independent coproporphyrinogen III oxidase [Verrucomicrobiota bacterium]
MGKLEVNLDLIKKYNVPGPRYTSYPPATQFTESVAWDTLRERIRQNNETPRDLSLYFHLPFCEALCWFCGCTTIITTQHDQAGHYLGYLAKELALVTPSLHPQRQVVQLHFGGGTPTFFRAHELRALGELIHKHFRLAPELEAGVEIDPRHCTHDQLTALREIGFNRASIGVQDNNPVVQKAVHRIQPRELTAEVVGWIRAAGFQSLNIDLIYGLPYQTVDSFARTLDEILELSPDRFAIFSYAHVPWIKPAQKILEKDALPTAEVKLDLLKFTIEKLTAEGYRYVGMDHFAKDTDELAVAQEQKTLQRNFQGYSTRGGADIYAFGMSSISQTDGVYWQNEKELPAYAAALDAGRWPHARGYVMNDDDKVRRRTIMRLMCDLSLDYRAMSRDLGLEFPKYFNRELASLDDLEADGLLRRTDQALSVTDAGRLLIRNIAMRFDAYLPGVKERRFSRTI